MTKKKYTKTQLKKDQVAAVIDTLEHEFDAQIDDADGGRFDVIINGFQGQFSRRDLEVMFNDSSSEFESSPGFCLLSFRNLLI